LEHRETLGRQERVGWGAKVTERLAANLQKALPEMKGLSARNLEHMRAFALAWSDEAFVQQAVAQIPCPLPIRMDRTPSPRRAFTR
jgi:hypothetical protein